MGNLPGYIYWRSVASARFAGVRGRVRVEASIDVLEGRRATPPPTVERERVTRRTAGPAFTFAAHCENYRSLQGSHISRSGIDTALIDLASG